MTGFSTPAKGSAGAATVTRWFGYVPDQFCCLSRCSVNSATAAGLYVDQQNASFANMWVPYNPAQLGGTSATTINFTLNTTAPDGTTNVAQKMVEAATSTPHGVVAAFCTGGSTVGAKTRLSGFFKAAERTRVALVVSNGRIDTNVFNINFFSGCITVFDLQGGQIGVPNTAFNGSQSFLGGAQPPPLYAAGPTEIVNFGGGWFRCSMDVLIGPNQNNNVGFAILIDAGSGTGAMNINYAGTAGSGIWTWRTTALPPAAWGINTSVFFDDFLSSSTIDLAQTGAPGFNWYLLGGWPASGSWLNFNPARITVAGSLMTLAPAAVGFTFVNSIAPVAGGTSYIGHVFQNPFLLEFSYAYDTSILPVNEVSLFSVSTEYLTHAVSTGAGVEYDFWQACPLGAPDIPNSNYSNTGGLGGADVIPAASWGATKWNATLAFLNNQVVDYNGVTYQSLISSNVGNVPTSTLGTAWNVFTSTFYQGGVVPQIDYSQQHKRSVLFLPATANDFGQSLTFLDGFYCSPNEVRGGGSHFAWGPTVSGNQPLTLGDKCHFPLMLSSDQARQMSWDWVRVSQ